MRRQIAERQRLGTRRILLGVWLALIVLVTLSGCEAGPHINELRAYWNPIQWAKSSLDTDGDNQQERQNQELLLVTGCGIGQSFVAHQANLSAIEIMLVLHSDPGVQDKITCRLRLSPDSADLAQSQISLRGSKHNDLLRFSFPPQADSAGRSYYFCLEASPESRAGVWAASFDAYGEGTLYREGRPADGDLRFATFGHYDLQTALSGLTRALMGYWWPLLATFALLFVPGALIMAAARAFESADLPGRLACALGLSLGFWPLLLLWTSAVGLRFSPLLGGVLLGALALTAAIYLWRWMQRERPMISAPDPIHLALAAILALTLATRYTEIRLLVLPAWVDSVHQTLMTRLIADQGQIPTSYAPFLPIEAFTRHFGFNVVAAWLNWLSGLAAPQAILILGQVLNALSILPVYALTTRLCKSRLAGLIGALVAGLISIMPAYYVSWGRYTQLTGMIVLPIALLALLDALADQSNSSCHSEHGTLKMPTKAWALAAFACAGLLVNHYRVLAFYACFALVYLLWVTAAHWRDRRLVIATWRSSCLIALVALILVLPWLANLWQHTIMPLDTFAERMKAESGYNVLPWELAEAGHGRTLIFLAKLALGWALLKTVTLAAWRIAREKAFSAWDMVIHLGRQLEQERAALLTLLWVALVQLMVNPHLIGLQDIWVLDNSSAVIALYLPLAIWTGYLFADLAKTVYRAAQAAPGSGRAIALFLRWAAALIIVLIGVRCARDLVSVINPVTILATRDDLAAMDWIRKNTSTEAKFLINTVHWQREIYRGADGGWWIPLLTDRQVTLPSAVYRAGTPAYIAEINEFARWAVEIKSLSDNQNIARLRQAGVTHVYIGAKGGPLTPQMLLASPYFRQIFSNGATWVFALLPDGEMQ